MEKFSILLVHAIFEFVIDDKKDWLLFGFMTVVKVKIQPDCYFGRTASHSYVGYFIWI